MYLPQFSASTSFSLVRSPSLTSSLRNQVCLNFAHLLFGASLCYKEGAFSLVSFWEAAALVFGRWNFSGQDRYILSWEGFICFATG